jgi:hypothetical protein
MKMIIPTAIRNAPPRTPPTIPPIAPLDSPVEGVGVVDSGVTKYQISVHEMADLENALNSLAQEMLEMRWM